jgi:DNA-directed RNA polymerase subunit beta'
MLKQFEAKEIEKVWSKEVAIRTPLTCRRLNVDYVKNVTDWTWVVEFLVRMGEAVGIVAAQAIGEPGTQLNDAYFPLRRCCRNRHYPRFASCYGTV